MRLAQVQRRSKLAPRENMVSPPSSEVTAHPGSNAARPPAGRWTDALKARLPQERRQSNPLVGVLPGEGIGPEVVGAALEVLRTVEEACETSIKTETGGLIGRAAEQAGGTVLPDDVIEFCENVFRRGGVILNGPGGGRYVYDLRKRFDLFFKISPLQPMAELGGACRLKPEAVRGVDILVARENISGVYQGRWNEIRSSPDGRSAEHSFVEHESSVRRFLSTAAGLAGTRRGEMTVVCKESGVPAVSALWRDCAAEVAAATGVRCAMMDVDHIAYRLVQHARDFDVIAAPNMCGDVLADLGAVLLGSRGVSFSGNFAADGSAVYQTNHGSAHDLAGSDRANPLGQILSLAMLLRESFGMFSAAALIEESVRQVLRAGWRTGDIAEPGCRVVGTREMGRLVADAVNCSAGSDRVAA